MRRSLSILALLPLVCAAALAQGDHAPDRIIGRLTDIALRERKGSGGLLGGNASIDALNAKYGCRGVRGLIPGNAPVVGGIDPAGFVAVEFDRAVDIPAAIADYLKTGAFRYLEPDYIGRGGSESPNDGYYERQWSLNNDGTFPLSSVKAGADMDMEDAWQIETGDSSVIVAILDSGCKLDHPEFAGRIWHNPKELAANGTDDDANGYVDDVTGWDFAKNDNSPIDTYGHGTNVAGIIGANGNNRMGYAGIDWRCKLMIERVLNDDNFGYYSWWASAIMYAADNGARVINMSLGGSSSSQAMQDAIDYAYARNVMVVASMGNENSGTPDYPAALRHVIAVGSTDPDDTRSAPFFWSPTSGSNYGAHISVVAPGNYIYGLSNTSNTDFNSYWGGTSQAAPHVTGLAALLVAQQPGRSVTQIRGIIENTADDRVGTIVEDSIGFDQYYGHGRVNAKKALCQNPPTLLPQITVIGKLPLGDSVVLDAGAYSGYLWSNGATTRTITVRKGGPYFVQVTNVCGMSATAPTVNVTADAPGLVATDIAASPGGVSNLRVIAGRDPATIIVRAELARRGTVALRVTDITGARLFSLAEERVAGEYDRAISVAALPRGVCFVTLEVDGSGRTVKFVNE